MTPTLTRATLRDLMRVDGKAELIGGRIVTFMASGDFPTALEIAVSLHDYARKRKAGRANSDGVGFPCSVLPAGRESFSPDAEFLLHADKPSMRFVEGASDFAVEVRSENVYRLSSLESADRIKRKSGGKPFSI